jgi:CheY-like chemotaxis protein
MAGDGRLTVETANRPGEPGAAVQPDGLPLGDHVVISVTDTGAGMPPEVAARAFEPFFTTKETGHGTGLGLSQVYGFARQSGGHAEIESLPGRGTTLRLFLPRHSGPLPDEAAVVAMPPLPPPGRGETVLVVEDDDRVRQMSAGALRELGFTVLEAALPSIALRLLGQHPEIALLFTDIIMPEMDGRRLAEEAVRRHPGLKVLFTTGHARDVAVREAALGKGPVRLLKKPFDLEALAAELREVLGAA